MRHQVGCVLTHVAQATVARFQFCDQPALSRSFFVACRLYIMRTRVRIFCMRISIFIKRGTRFMCWWLTRSGHYQCGGVSRRRVGRPISAEI